MITIQGSCSRLKEEWTAIKTTTQFPVVPGTVVEVNCFKSGALNKGSSEVTCTSGTEFSFEFNEPECIKTGIVETDVFNDHATKRYLNSFIKLFIRPGY